SDLSAAESRIVLGVPDAYELPSYPSSGFLKIDMAGMTRFKAAYVSGPAEPETPAPSAPRRVKPVIVPYGPQYIEPQVLAYAPAVALPPGGQNPAHQQESLLDRIVAQLARQGPAARQIWLPPLRAAPALDRLLPPPVGNPPPGFSTPGWER